MRTSRIFIKRWRVYHSCKPRYHSLHLKKQANSLNHRIIKLMNRSAEDLLTKINEENIDNYFIQDLIIFAEEKRKDTKEPLISKEYEL